MNISVNSSGGYHGYFRHLVLDFSKTNLTSHAKSTPFFDYVNRKLNCFRQKLRDWQWKLVWITGYKFQAFPLNIGSQSPCNFPFLSSKMFEKKKRRSRYFHLINLYSFKRVTQVWHTFIYCNLMHDLFISITRCFVVECDDDDGHSLKGWNLLNLIECMLRYRMFCMLRKLNDLTRKIAHVTRNDANTIS